MFDDLKIRDAEIHDYEPAMFTDSIIPIQKLYRKHPEWLTLDFFQKVAELLTRGRLISHLISEDGYEWHCGLAVTFANPGNDEDNRYLLALPRILSEPDPTYGFYTDRHVALYPKHPVKNWLSYGVGRHYKDIITNQYRLNYTHSARR